jgi:hypothetical protein
MGSGATCLSLPISPIPTVTKLWSSTVFDNVARSASPFAPQLL